MALALTLDKFDCDDLQEIFYNIPDANVTTRGGTDVFAVAISRLDDYFAPKQNKVYERHLFRLLKQEPNEKFEKFLVRLRQQANKCQFQDRNDNIIDQIVEKCASIELRKKILQMGDDVTLERIIKEANSLESVNMQLEGFDSVNKTMQGINKIFTKANNTYGTSTMHKTKLKIQTNCGRCGNRNHGPSSPLCPARNKDCLKCGLVGHFRQYCKTKQPLKRKLEAERHTEGKKKAKVNDKQDDINQVDELEKISKNIESETPHYVFHIDDDDEFECMIGGVNVTMLVDSGCKQNLIMEETWNKMKTKKVTVDKQIPNPDVKFMAYGSNVPLEIKGSFEANIQVGGSTKKATFYVIKNGTRNLLGKLTAMALGILKIGLNLEEINQLDISTFPKLKDVLIELPIDDSVTPISQPYRRIPIPIEDKVAAKIDELARRDIIEEVRGSSKWVSPIVPILKDNGDIEIDPHSRYITTFITSKGLYQYKRLMFGISCAPEIFQKTLERILVGCDGVINFIDDILIFGKDLAEHDRRLEKVMKVLKENNVMLNKDKCRYRLKKVSFLGHELSEHGIRPLEKYISTVQQFRPPTTVGEIRSFLGLINFVSKWIPNVATLTEPLKELLRNKHGDNFDITNGWGENQRQSFNALKSALTNVTTLGYYNVKDRTIVVADASSVGLGSVLIQVDGHGPRVIAYGHKTLTDCERRYCQTEKEALALVWAIEHFHIFLYGKQFELVTDHKPLEVIFGIRSKPCARIERWVLRLQSYNYKVVYRPGKTNIADPFSRLCNEPKSGHTATRDNYVHQIVENSLPVAVSLTEIMRCSSEDQEILKVKDGVYNSNWHEDVKLFKIFQDELCFYEGILLRGTRIVVPESLRERVLKAAHEGHPGIVGMKARLRTKVWWPKCDKDAETMVKSCKGCTLVSGPNPPHPLKRRELPEEPWMDVAVDLMGPLPSGDYLFVIVDYYSRYKEIKICRKITTVEVVTHLKEIFSRLGNPASITADNGKQFCSEEFKSFCTQRNIVLFNTVPYWPQQNGEVERQNRDILKRLKISQVEKKNWRESLLDYLMMYNSTPHTVTGKTPSELFFKRRFRDKLPMINDIHGKPQEGDLEMRDRDRVNKEKGKIYSDRKRKAERCTLEAGDKVYVKQMSKDNKLSLNYDSTPHTVRKSHGGDILVENDETGQICRRNIVHLKRVEGQWKVCNENESEQREEKEGDGNQESIVSG
ncbi:uncharacterized protein K02A2.6-like [Pectinophora gossypiella]|uniref:uncharacterized protein K02A2.6-like n=1 Tax=Pectinophora gossypiella TaxID=13191 RepID=UPI00214E33DF|nr:uncharacterized protein K02A2.6-like [Pectinophora gossypiella]